MVRSKKMSVTAKEMRVAKLLRALTTTQATGAGSHSERNYRRHKVGGSK
jgi:hypothetical protein